MKKLMILISVLLIGAVLLSAQGFGRSGGRGSGYGGGGWGSQGNWGAALSEESVSGRLEIRNGIPSVGDYTLVIPGQVVLKSGDNVEAKGFVSGSSMTVSWLKSGTDEYIFGSSSASGGYGGFGRGRGGFGGGSAGCPMLTGGFGASGDFQEYSGDNLEMGDLTLE